MSCTEINREYKCVILLVKALIQFLSPQERKKACEWLQKLEEFGDELPDASIRNEYMSYLLMNVQNGRMMTPFNLMPPCGKLRPLSRVLPDHLYEDAVRQFKMNICFIGNECEPQPREKSKALSGDPANFRSEQPRPLKGIIAHCSAFSNYEE